MMSKPREIWWGYAKNMIRQYPKIQMEESTPHMSNTMRKECAAVEKAISITQNKRNGNTRLEVVDFVLWKKKGTLYMAAVKLFLSVRTAERYHHDFIQLVAECYGLTE